MTRYILILVALCAPQFAHATIALGVDYMLKHEARQLMGKRVSILTNHTGRTGDGRRTIDAVKAVHGVNLVSILTPEHGLQGMVTAGSAVASSVDSLTRLPVFSLYGATRKPTPDMLRNIDVLIFDVQDIGVRSYTFISTLGLAMQACAEMQVQLIVCDRPSMLARRVDGNVLDTAFRSFVGQYPVPYVYGMTVGELATMINTEMWMGPRCDLTVMPMVGWRREMTWEQTGIEWIPTSPNIPRPSTIAYCAAFGVSGEVGVGYLGTGSPNAFRVFAQPSLQRAAFDSAMRAEHVKGLSWTMFDTTITSREGTPLPETGVRFLIDRDSADDLFAMGLHLIAALHRIGGWKHPDSAHVAMFNKVCGGDLFTPLWRGDSVASITASWSAARAAFRVRRDRYLLYP
jgi:uncharacterized protein YbbC (DUF1343 family)